MRYYSHGHLNVFMIIYAFGRPVCLLAISSLQLHIIGRRSAKLDWLRFKRPMLTSFQKASEQDFRATK